MGKEERHSLTVSRRSGPGRWRLICWNLKSGDGYARSVHVRKSPCFHPERASRRHVEFREAGSEMLAGATFYASRDKLATCSAGDPSSTS